MPKNISTHAHLFILGFDYHLLTNTMYNKSIRPASKDYTALWILRRFKSFSHIAGIDDTSLDSDLDNLIGQFEKLPPNVNHVNEAAAGLINDKISKHWLSLVNKTLAKRILFLEVEQSLISIEKLRKGVEAFFTPTVLTRIKKAARLDLQDGIDCILSQHWTPSVMVTLRAVEGVLRRYFERKTGKKVILANGHFLNWNDILRELNALPMGQDLLESLRYLKERRNEAQHPDQRFSQDRAENTFIYATNAIKLMA